MPSGEIRLGVDFGTSNTVAMVRRADGRVQTLLFDGSPLLPSAVYADPAGPLIAGRDALHAARLDPARFEPNPKRRIDDGTVLLGDHEVPVAELIAAVLRRVAEEFRRTVGAADAVVTLTVPATWGSARRATIAAAAETAGLTGARLVPEPVAAAAHFSHAPDHDVPVGSVVVVHDFGAGTFDASVVARTAGGFEVLAVDGRDDIGGIDLDDAVVRHIGAAAAPHDPAAWQRLLHPATVEDRRARRLLWDDARIAKEQLSRLPAADVTVPLLNVEVRLTREELEELAGPMLAGTVEVTLAVLERARRPGTPIAGVYLVGGASRMPLVATLLLRALRIAPHVIEQPELIVAEGGTLPDADTTCTEPPPAAATGESPPPGEPPAPRPFPAMPSRTPPQAPPPGPVFRFVRSLLRAVTLPWRGLRTRQRLVFVGAELLLVLLSCFGAGGGSQEGTFAVFGLTGVLLLVVAALLARANRRRA